VNTYLYGCSIPGLAGFGITGLWLPYRNQHHKHPPSWGALRRNVRLDNNTHETSKQAIFAKSILRSTQHGASSLP